VEGNYNASGRCLQATFDTQKRDAHWQIRASEGSNIATRMSEMRAWLDDRRFEPDLFNYDVVPSGVVFREEFKVAGEAMAFAEAFHGRVLDLQQHFSERSAAPKMITTPFADAA
jgi:hypothetical protein